MWQSWCLVLVALSSQKGCGSGDQHRDYWITGGILTNKKTRYIKTIKKNSAVALYLRIMNDRIFIQVRWKCYFGRKMAHWLPYKTVLEWWLLIIGYILYSFWVYESYLLLINRFYNLHHHLAEVWTQTNLWLRCEYDMWLCVQPVNKPTMEHEGHSLFMDFM